MGKMGLLSLVEDRPTPKAVYNWRVWACAAVAYVSAHWLGRKWSLIAWAVLFQIGAAGGSVCMWVIGGYLNANPVTDGGSVNNLSGGGIAAIFFFYLWTAFYIPSWNGTPWVYDSEMFPQSVRSLGQAIAAASNWFWNFIIARFTPQMFSNMGPSGCGVYYFFASMMILSIVWVWFL